MENMVEEREVENSSSTCLFSKSGKCYATHYSVSSWFYRLWLLRASPVNVVMGTDSAHTGIGLAGWLAGWIHLSCRPCRRLEYAGRIWPWIKLFFSFWWWLFFPSRIQNVRSWKQPNECGTITCCSWTNTAKISRLFMYLESRFLMNKFIGHSYYMILLSHKCCIRLFSIVLRPAMIAYPTRSFCECNNIDEVERCPFPLNIICTTTWCSHEPWKIILVGIAIRTTG